MALLELLSKAGMARDVDFLREGVQVLALALVDADASRQIGGSRTRGQCNARPIGTGTGPAVGHSGRAR